MVDIDRNELKQAWEGFQEACHLIIANLEGKRRAFVQMGEDATALSQTCRECISTCDKIINDIEVPHQRILAKLARHGMLVQKAVAA